MKETLGTAKALVHVQRNETRNKDKCLGVEISKHRDGTYEQKQPCLTRRIVEELNLAQFETQKLPTPVSSPLFLEDLDGKERVKRWNYW